MMKVIDLMPGIGARSIAFEKAGFQILCAIGDIDEDADIYCKIINPENYIFKNIQDIDPATLPDADVVLGRLARDVFYKGKDKNVFVMNGFNGAIYNIIACNRPKFFVLEAPVSFLNRSNRQTTENMLAKYIDLGYRVLYNIFSESDYSGFPVSGNQLFFVGIRSDVRKQEYYFPKPKFSDYKREYPRENEHSIDPWYREVRRMESIEYTAGKLYLREGKQEKETKLIQMGFFKEMYLVDSIGLRRFTHNELARLKGIEGYDFNKCSNKKNMYRKIAYSSNVYIVEAIAKTLIDYAYTIEDNQDQEKISVIQKKKKRVEQKQVFFPKHKITNIHIDELKGLKNLDIPINRSLTAIMGVNGSGKSTILHALACVYSPYEKGDDYKFSFFFTPNPDSDWKNSRFELTYYDENEQREITRIYKKDSDRWAPRYINRPMRDAYFIGIETCIPEIEREKQTSFIDYSTDSLDDSAASKILRSAAYILNKDYQSLMMHKTKKKELLGVHTESDLTYSSLSMGAGEQRVLKILRLVYSVNSYSLILIDEIDLLLHVTALKKLIEELHNIAEKKKLQIIFTTHSLEIIQLREYVDVRYLERLDQKTMVYHAVNSDMIYEMNNIENKPIEIYVEDLLAEVIIRQIAEDLKILRSVKIVKCGASSNAFGLAASYILKGEDFSNILIVLDGDVYREYTERVEAVNRVLSGTEKDHEEKVKKAVSMIRQFNLPLGMAPEKYIFDMLIEMDIQNEIVRCAKQLKAVSDSHQWLDELTSRMGHEKEQILFRIIDIVSQNPRWGHYIEDVHNWMIEKRTQLNLEILDN